jgi:hypothetical protein
MLPQYVRIQMTKKLKNRFDSNILGKKITKKDLMVFIIGLRYFWE